MLSHNKHVILIIFRYLLIFFYQKVKSTHIIFNYNTMYSISETNEIIRSNEKTTIEGNCT